MYAMHWDTEFRKSWGENLHDARYGVREIEVSCSVCTYWTEVPGFGNVKVWH